jgi:subtilisin family serine protease
MVATMLCAASAIGEASAADTPDPSATVTASEWEYTAAATASSDDVELVRVETQGDDLSVSTITVANPEAAARYEARAELDPDVIVEPVIWRHSHGAAGTLALPAAIDPQTEEQWNIEMMGPRPSGATGAGMTVAILDSGIRPGLFPRLDSRITGRADFAKSVAYHWYNHGAAVADVVLQVAPDANILDVIVGDANGLRSDQIALGIRWAVREGADVINMSFGGPRPSAVEKAAIDWAVSMGVVMVAASGNEAPDTTPNYPSRFPNVIAVGSLDDDGQVSDFSSTGNHLDAWAPGGLVPVHDRMSVESGTSFAAPHIAGLAALVKSARPGWNPENIQAAIELSKTSVQVPIAGTTKKPIGVASFGALDVPDGPDPELVTSISSSTSARQQNLRYRHCR